MTTGGLFFGAVPLPRCWNKAFPHEATMEQSLRSSLSFTLVAKFGKERITITDLEPTTTIGHVKTLLQGETNILTHRQKLIGLVSQNGGSKGVHDELAISDLKTKGGNKNEATRTIQFILMGTPEEKIFVDPQDRAGGDLPDIVDDFDLEFSAGSDQWFHHKANEENLRKFSASTPIHILHPPREGKPLMVLDLDHTLLDFSAKTLLRNGTTSTSSESIIERMKRPYMDQFLAQCYELFDLVVWSQTR